MCNLSRFLDGCLMVRIEFTQEVADLLLINDILVLLLAAQNLGSKMLYNVCNSISSLLDCMEHLSNTPWPFIPSHLCHSHV
jgi:hypothetical protein